MKLGAGDIPQTSSDRTISISWFKVQKLICIYAFKKK